MPETFNSNFEPAIVSRDVTPPLSDISQSLSDFIISRLPDTSHPLGKPAHHHFKKAGKQLRGRMALTAADCFGVPQSISMRWAAAVEILHNASLVHDDICDGDMVRRGMPSVWAQYGKDTALALGDWLIALSFELASEAACIGQTPKLVSVLSHHMAATTTGQALEFAIDSYPSWSKYMDISTGKTAPLFVASVEGIAHLAGRNDVITPLQRFFTAAGGCYQIANDMLNVIGKDGAASPASDLLRRAPNAVIVMFRTTLDREHAAEFDSWLASGSEHNALNWQTRLRRSPALSMTSSALMSMFDEAESSSDALPSDCQAIITPIKAQLRHVCRDLVADNS
ncbi:MAG: polyprenyl synthetase family protein [Alphaproteobacteria bacterium]|nr:polyprenyl synthetase family protein [Alphaproteobacteria bacterium]MBL6776661.1 polyprenyl synthetase family protein [Alphaproteobacteria bacterium]